MSCVGTLRLARRWWGSRCGCAPGGYAADAVVGLGGRCTRRLQQHVCRLAADVAFAKVREHVRALLAVPLSAEAIRQVCHGHGRRLARWQGAEEATPRAFARAAGAVEFAVDAGKVHTREAGWKDLKIAVFQKRPAGPAATPDQWRTRALPAPTAVVAWAAGAPARRFRRGWRRWGRRLGVTATADLHTLADGAAWIWKAVARVFPGGPQTLDIYHACQHLAAAGQRLYGEGTPAAAAFLERGRTLLLEAGWEGITRLVGAEYAREDTPARRRALEKLLGYFAKHVGRLGYRQRLAAGQAIGSGAVEGWAKTLGLRLKARGARWRLPHVLGMAALGCVRHSCQWSAYWSAAA